MGELSRSAMALQTALDVHGQGSNPLPLPDETLQLAECQLELGSLDDALRRFEAAAEMYRARSDGAGIMKCLQGVASIHSKRGRADLAIKAVEDAGRVPGGGGKDWGVSPQLLSPLKMAEVYFDNGRYDEAINQYDKVLAGGGADSTAAVRALLGCGKSLMRLQNVSAAISKFQLAVQRIEGVWGGGCYVLKDIRNIVLSILMRQGGVGSFLKGECLFNLGEALYENSSHECLVFVVRALAEFQASANRAAEASALTLLAAAQLKFGSGSARDRFGDAERNLQRALDVFIETGDSSAQGDVMFRLGQLYSKNGQYDKGGEYFSKVLTVQTRLGDRRAVALCLKELAAIAALSGDRDGAITRYMEAYEVLRALQDSVGCAEILNNVAVLRSKGGDLEGAISNLKEAAVLMEGRPGLVKCQLNFGTVLASAGRFEEAVAQFNKALDASTMQVNAAASNNLDYLKERAACLSNLGSAYHHLGDAPLAIRQFDEARAIAREAKLPDIEAQALYNKAAALFAAAKTREAIPLFEEAAQVAEGVGECRFDVVYSFDTQRRCIRSNRLSYLTPRCGPSSWRRASGCRDIKGHLNSARGVSDRRRPLGA